ncbi:MULTISPECIES: 7-carboxy-7-deazaguanine synthase QueE [Ureibacillus]|uniref:7-carboxy-7-deazaguanine synthase n=1 Tax=Ureibacillus thermosphaericus TaxID=51173 RepID=A0A840Q0C9_URETH|nr:7-carboxy-7-deazaguanine synthase QueE [Ureibacillus thermosphaericus]MBB5150371.1 7-carboxy-7-deazaguanine synthase [Ureibacillus thermosphaericus]NKZ32988.1 7-carboxy-7-deazaguanine synthase QueE [Ureibacillus thermosphaericus]
MSKIAVIEIFGPTIQGEGMVIGQKTMFVRTAGCDYSCSWCDSAFTWDGSGKSLIKQMTAEEIWTELKRLGGNGFSFVTISGGNPVLIRHLEALVRILKENDIRIGVETQGSRWQDWLYEIDELTISPKPPSSGMKTDFTVLTEIIDKLNARNGNQHISLKVVVFDEEDYEYAKKVHLRYPTIPFFLQVGNDDTTTKDQTKLVSHLLKKYESLINKVMADEELQNVKVLPQLHTLVWGNKRGV